MQCRLCGGNTHPETVVRIGRGLSWGNTTRSQGWFCWTCKTSQEAASPSSEAAGRQAGLAARLFGAIRRPQSWQAAAADSFAGSRAGHVASF